MVHHEVKELKNSNLEVLNHGISVVDFWAPWCGPCRSFAPVFEELATQMPGVTFLKVNVDDEQELATAHNIRSIPTLIIFKDGEVVDTLVGVQHKDDLKNRIEKHC